MAASGEPRLQQRRVGRHRHERQPDRDRKQAELPQVGLALRRIAEPARHADRQADDGQQAYSEVDVARQMRRRLVDQEVGIEVAGEQRGLEEEHRHRPHRRRAAEHGKHRLGEHRLDREQEQRGEEGGGREGPHHGGRVAGQLDQERRHPPASNGPAMAARYAGTLADGLSAPRGRAGAPCRWGRPLGCCGCGALGDGGWRGRVLGDRPGSFGDGTGAALAPRAFADVSVAPADGPPALADGVVGHPLLAFPGSRMGVRPCRGAATRSLAWTISAGPNTGQSFGQMRALAARSGHEACR